jgi:hypothetical protein
MKRFQKHELQETLLVKNLDKEQNEKVQEVDQSSNNLSRQKLNSKLL